MTLSDKKIIKIGCNHKQGISAGILNYNKSAVEDIHYIICTSRLGDYRYYTGFCMKCGERVNGVQNNKFSSGWMTPSEISKFIDKINYLEK